MKIKLVVVAFVLFAVKMTHAVPWSLTVVNENGKPVQASVWVRAAASGENRQLSTDAAGHSAGDTRSSWGQYSDTFLVFAAGHAPAGGRLQPGENRVKLGAPRTLSGRVVDDGGKPVPNIMVRVSRIAPEYDGDDHHTYENSIELNLLPQANTLFAAQTDNAGRYTLRNLPERGTALIEMSDRLWQKASLRVDLGHNQDAPDMEAKAAARLSGRVLGPDGAPLAGKTVYAADSSGSVSAQTDGEGRYVLGGLWAGKATVMVAGDPQSDSSIASGVETNAVIGAETPVPDIRMTQGALIEVKTVPTASGGQFTLHREGAPPNEKSYAKAKNGVIHIRVQPGIYLFDINTPPKGWMAPPTWPAGGIKIEAVDGPINQAEISLIPALVLKGMARDEAGKPVAGALLYRGGDAPDIVTDAEGRFSIPNLKPGEIYLRAAQGWDPEWEIIKPTTVTLPAPQPVEVTLSKATFATLRGRVIDARGAPIADAAVTVDWMATQVESGPNTHISISQSRRMRSGADGRYEAKGIRADAQITVTAKKPKHRFMGGGQWSIASTILGVNGMPVPNPNPVFTVSDIVLQPLTRAASGRVVNTAGKPVANAIVAALGGGLLEYGAAPHDIVRTDAEGLFKLSDLPVGELGFVAGAGDSFAQITSEVEMLPDLVLQPQMTRPVRDPALARQLVMNIIAAPDGNYGNRQSLPGALAPYDFQAALDAAKALSPDGKVKRSALRGLMWELVRTSPQEARTAFPAFLRELAGEDKDKDKGDADAAWLDVSWPNSFQIDVSRLVPQPEQETLPGEAGDAAALRAWLHRSFAQARNKLAALDTEKTSDITQAYQFMALAGLGRRLRTGDVQRWSQTAIDIAARADAESPEGAGGNVAYVVAGLAAGGADLVEKNLGAVPPERRAYALRRAIVVLARTDLAGAHRLLELIPAQISPKESREMDSDPESAFGFAAKVIIASMDAGEAAAALTLARRVTSRAYRADALALAARMQPKDEAAALFHEAFKLAVESGDPRRQARVVGQALFADTATGEALLAEMGDAFFQPDRSREAGQSLIPLFYLAQTQPGGARAWIEWKWGHALYTANDISGLGERGSLAMAMSAVDTRRALEMAASIPPRINTDGSADSSARWEAQRRIAQYLAAPESARHRPISNPWDLGDTWAPDADIPW